MLRKKLMKKGLARAMALTLAVSLAMPGSAFAAATQPSVEEAAVEEAAVEDAYEEEGAKEAVEIDGPAEETTDPTDESSEAEETVDEDAPVATGDEEDPAIAENEDDEAPAEAEEAEVPEEPEKGSVVNEDNTADEASADTEDDIRAQEDVTDPATQEEATEPVAAPSGMNEVTEVSINQDDYTGNLGLYSNNTYQINVDVTYDSSGSYETNEPVYFRSNNESVVSVDSNGLVTAVGTGYAYVSVYTKTEYYDEYDEEYYENEYTWDSVYFEVFENLYSVKFDLNGGVLADGLEEENASTCKMFTNGTTGNEDECIYIRTFFYKDSEYCPVAVREGYKFEGWTETKDGEDEVDNYYYPSKDTTLYAKWSKMITVKFDLNGGTLAAGLETENEPTYKLYKDGATVSEGDYVYLLESYWNGSVSVPVLVRNGGYRFDGWTETKDGAKKADYFYYPTKDVTLYAKWTKVYKVTFDTNGGTWSDSYYEREYGNGYQEEKGKSFYLPDSYELKRSGYKLLGWTTTKNGTSVLNGQYTVSKDITLYAKWGKTYKVTFNAGAGYFGSDTSAKTQVLEIESGKDIGDYLDYSSYTPHNGSKVFLGWYKDSALTNPAKKSDTITKDTTYYAKYETKVYKITVTNLKGASYTNRATGEYIYGDKSTAESYAYYIRQGDEIGYLYADKDSESARFFFDQDCKTKPYFSDYVPTGNTTVYAKWNSEVTITWDADGGQNWNGKSTGTVTCKKNLMCEDLPDDLTKTGYYFVGWYDTADSTKKILPASHVFKANTTVKAKWATGIKITLKANGGKFSDEKDTAVIYIKAKTSVGGKYVSREGYTCTGWKNSVTGKVVTSLYDEKPERATTYTAVWARETKPATATVNVTLLAGDGSLYDRDNRKYVTKLVVKVEKGSTYDRFYHRVEHDESYKRLQVSGWSLTKNGTELKSSYTFTKDVTLYPLWDKTVEYLSVALVTNGGAIDNRPRNNPRVYNVVKDSTISLPTAINMEKEGFIFGGWYTDPSFKTKVSTPEDYKVTKSCYLYAKWQAQPTGGNTSLGKTTRGDMFNLANNVKVTWNAVSGAKYYKVYREGITDPSETQKDPVIVTTGLVGWDKSPGLTNGHAYRYWIVASTTGAGNSSGDSSQVYSKIMYRLKTVVIRSAKNTGAGEVTVNYDKTTSGDSYVLQYCEREDMVGAKTKVVLGAYNTSYKIGGLKKGKTYYISIRVRKKVDGIDYYTTFGVAKKVTITK